MVEGPTNDSSDIRSKVASLLERYNLDGLGDELERSWLGNGTEQKSLRTLADEFNRRLLEAAMQNEGMEVLDGEPENFYRLLTDDDVSRGTRIQSRHRLIENGIDVDELLADFVSRQAIHTYLTKVRGVDYPDGTDAAGDRRRRGVDSINRLKNRLAAVSEQTVESLANADELTVGEADFLVSVRVTCSTCGMQAAVGEFIENRGCNCGTKGD